MPGPHGFAVRSDLNQRFDRPCAASQNFGEGVEAPFVCAPLSAHSQPALRPPLRANAAASTASHPAFVTTAIRPSCRERTGRAGRTDLPDGESEIFFERGLDRFLSRRLICPSGAGVGWAKALLRRAHHPFSSLSSMVGTLRFAHPCNNAIGYCLGIPRGMACHGWQSMAGRWRSDRAHPEQFVAAP